MIVMRFRSVGWVAAVAVAALGCYVVTQRVAGERRQLAAVARDILHGRRDIRQMEIEIETRGRLSQLEQWNSEVLSLSAPTARQYLKGEVQLARLDTPAPLPIDPTAAPPASAVRSVAYHAPAAPAAAARPTPLLAHATYLKTHEDRLGAKVTTVALDSNDFAADLDALAAREAGMRRR